MDSPGTSERPTSPSGWLLAAAVIMLVLGTLGMLGGLVAVVIAMLADSALELFGSVGTEGPIGRMLAVVAGFSMIGGVLGILLIVTGIGVLRRAAWARIGGIVVAGLDLALTTVANVWSLIPGTVVDPLTGGPLSMSAGEVVLGSLVPLLTVAGHVVVIAVLVRSRTELER